MSSVSRRGLSIMMALLVSFGTVGVAGAMIDSDMTIVASAASVSNKTFDVGDRYTFDTAGKDIVIENSNDGVVNVSKTIVGEKTRISIVAIAPGKAEITIKYKSGGVIETLNITVKGTVKKSTVNLYTDDYQYIKTDESVRVLLNTDSTKFINKENFGAKLTDSGIRVWGDPGKYSIRVVTANSTTDYTVNLSQRTYEYVKGNYVKKSYVAKIKSLTSSNKSIVEIEQDGYNYGFLCKALGSSTIKVTYTDGTKQSFVVKVRDAKTYSVNAGDALVGTSKTVDYSQYSVNGSKITEAKCNSSNSKFVTTKITGNKIEYKVANDLGKAFSEKLKYTVKMSNGDIINTTINISSVLTNSTVNVEKTTNMGYEVKGVSANGEELKVSKDGTKVKINGRKTGTYKLVVTNSNNVKNTYYVKVNHSNKTYNKTIGYNKDGTKIAVVELKNSGATVKNVTVDKKDIMEVTRWDYSVILKPKKAGKATVTVTCTNGDIIKYVCTVNSLYKTYNKSVTLDTKNAKTVSVEDDIKLKAKGLKITKVENKSTALIKDVKKADYTFKYTMIKKGTAIVKVTLSNGDIVTYNIVIK